MSDADDIEEIREQKRAELLEDADVPDEPIHVEGADHLSELVAEHDVVFVDFHADWCGPCQMLEPTMESIAGDAVVAKVDVDAHQELAGQYGVRGVPTVLLFAGGDQVEQVVGVREEGHYRDLLARHGA